MKAQDLGDIARMRLRSTAVVLEFTDEGGFGKVLTALEERRFVSHRWAVTDTAGAPIPGGMFWSGHYFCRLDEALDDYKARL